jgi:hypothetical protein
MWPARIAEYLPTAAAIPTYLALVGLAVGGEYRPSVGDGIILLVAPGLFLVASALFALGYLPVQRRFSLDLPAEVEEARAGTIRRRYRFATFGFIVFALGTTWAIAGVTYAPAAARKIVARASSSTALSAVFPGLPPPSPELPLARSPRPGHNQKSTITWVYNDQLVDG